MRSFGAWFGRLAMAGTCLLGAGCGSSDVPDPDSDSHAATSETPRGPLRRRGEEPPPEPASGPDASALASNTNPPAETEKPKADPKPDEKPADSDKAAPSTTGGSSATDEMLKSGNQGSTPPSGGSTPPGGSSTPSGPSTKGGTAPPGNYPGASGSTPNAAPPGGGTTPTPDPSPNGGGNATGNAGGATTPGIAPGPGSNANGPVRRNPGGGAGGPGAPAAPGGAGPGPVGPDGGGAPGAPGGPGASGFGGTPGPGGPPGQDASTQGAAAFNRPSTAVVAFLAAVKAKDKERLKETVALHAPTEAAEKHRKIFNAIIEESITDDELDEMAKALDGYQVVQQLAPTSTRKIGIIISKMSGRDRFQRTIMTRQEKAGWKVLDVDNALEFKFIATPTRRGRR